MICWTRSPDGSNASRGKTRCAEEPQRPGVPGSFDAAIERFEKRLSRAEVRAARAFEWVAQMLERADAARDGDRRALLQAVRGLEAIKGNRRAPAQTGEAQEDGLAARHEADRPSTERIDEIARRAGKSDRASSRLRRMRFRRRRKSISRSQSLRSPCAARNSTRAPAVARRNHAADSGTVTVEAMSGGAAAPAEAKQRRGEGDAVARVDSQHSAEGSDAPPLRAPDSRLASPPSELLRDDVEPSNASSTACGANGGMNGPARPTSAGCAPRSRP